MPTKSSNPATHTAICPHTKTRREACGCRYCTRGSTPETKYQANLRDARALINLLAGRLETDRANRDRINWTDVGDLAHLRGELMDLVVGLALGPDGSEEAAHRRIEEALGTEDEHVDEALIDAM